MEIRKIRQPVSIRRKLILFFLAFFCIPFLIFSFIWYTKSAETLEKSGFYYNEQLIKRINTQLDDYFAGIQSDTQTIPGNALVQQFIKVDPVHTYELFGIMQKLNSELIPNTVYKRKDIYGFALLSTNGAYFGDFVLDNQTKGSLDLQGKDDNFRIQGISEVSGIPVLTIYRKIFDNVSYQPSGAIIIRLKLDRMLKIMDLKPYGKTGYMAIVNEANEFIYHPDRLKWGTPIAKDWIQHINASSGQFVQNEKDGKKIVVYESSGLTGFTIISVMATKEMLAGLVQLQVMTIIIGAIIIVLAFIMFYRMFWEIKRLTDVIHMKRLREKELELKQREAIMHALQSRINPHFLYNTLEIINSYALIAKVQPISQMTLHLSHMFRYSIGSPEQLVCLREEIAHINSYIKIQEERFEDLKFSLDIDEIMQDRVYVFRLTIQPLLENAFSHAFEKHGLSPGQIAITGEANEGCFILRVVDSGQGMPVELMEKYNRSFDFITENQMLRAGFSPFEKIGLWNVHSRLRLAFGPPYGIRIVRSGLQGTEIEIKVPGC